MISMKRTETDVRVTQEGHLFGWWVKKLILDTEPMYTFLKKEFESILKKKSMFL